MEMRQKKKITVNPDLGNFKSVYGEFIPLFIPDGPKKNMFLNFLISMIQRKFPDTPTIDTQTLQNWIKDDSKSLLILDSRSWEEYKVSHLPNSVHLDFNSNDDVIRDILQSQDGNFDTIICYCSVGYRSAILTQKLGKMQEAKNNSVFNLEGSIFKWAKENRDLVVDDDDDRKSTIFVHPYNRFFGIALPFSKWKWRP